MKRLPRIHRLWWPLVAGLAAVSLVLSGCDSDGASDPPVTSTAPPHASSPSPAATALPSTPALTLSPQVVAPSPTLDSPGATSSPTSTTPAPRDMDLSRIRRTPFVPLDGPELLLVAEAGYLGSRVPGSGVRGRGSGERETTASSLAGKEESSRKEDNSGQGKDGPAGAIAQGRNGR